MFTATFKQKLKKMREQVMLRVITLMIVLLVKLDEIKRGGRRYGSLR